MPDSSEIVTIDQVIDLARERLDSGEFAWAAAGAGQGVTTTRNTLALNQLALVPRVGRDVTKVDTSTSFAGVGLAFPVMLAPIGALGVYDPGDALSAATAATVSGISVFCSIFSTAQWEEVAATRPGTHFFQLYVIGDRGWQAEILSRVEDAGFAGVCVTMDSPTIGRRDSSLSSGFSWSSPADGTVNLDPKRLDPRHRTGFTWDDLEWICAQTRLPLIAKGVMSAEDAIAAVAAGVRAVYVSNHGGRMVDHSLSTIEALPSIVAAVPDHVDVAVDSGFTRGVEVCKAIALGARAVGIGRLQCWCLAAGGVPTLTRVLEILRDEVAITLANSGYPTPADLSPEMVTWSMPAPPQSG